MSSEASNPGPTAAFANVEFFKTYLETYADQAPSVSLYRNGRQQCYIRVDFVATDASGNQVILDPSQVRLINYSTGAEIPHGTAWDRGDMWYSSFTDRGYSWDRFNMAEAQALQDDVDKVLAEGIDVDLLEEAAKANRGRIRSLTSSLPQHQWDFAFFAGMVIETRRCRCSDSPPDDRSIGVENIQEPRDTRQIAVDTLEWPGTKYSKQSVRFYVSTLDKMSLALAAALVQPSGPRVTTNDSTVPNDNGMGNGAGQFNSQVVVRPLEPPVYPIESFGEFKDKYDSDWVLQDHYVWWGSGNDLRACEQYILLKINGTERKLLQLVSPSMTRVSLYNDAGDVGAEWCYSYAGQPGSSTLYHPLDIIGFFRSGNNNSFRFTSIQLVEAFGDKIKTPVQGRITIGQLMSNEHLQISDWNGVGRAQRSVDIVVEDEYGNHHNLRLYLPSGYYKFNYVALAKR